MKKTITALTLIFLLVPSLSLAQSKTPAQQVPSSSEAEKIGTKVDELKDRVASRVAQLNLVERRGILGVVESVSDTKINIVDHNGVTRIVDVDELTKFSSEDDKSYGISDIKKGSKVSALGLYNKESKRLLARFINEIEIPLFVVGVVSEKDEDNFTITVSTEEGIEYIVDIERVTKTFSYDDGDLTSSGFTKIEVKENAVILGFENKKEKNKISATRVITFPNLPNNPKVPIIEEDTRSSPTPTKKEPTLKQ